MAQVLRQLIPVESGHVHIGQYQVEDLLLTQGQRLLAIVGKGDRAAELLQLIPQYQLVDDIVLRHQHMNAQFGFDHCLTGRCAVSCLDALGLAHRLVKALKIVQPHLPVLSRRTRKRVLIGAGQYQWARPLPDDSRAGRPWT